SVTADGVPPLSYQWFHDEAEIPGATTNFLILTNFSISDTGKYSVRITNSTESIVSSNAVLTLQPTVFSDVMTPLWRIAPGSTSHPFLLNDGGSRGIAYNPSTGNLLVVSRSASNAVHVLDPNTGAY